MKKLTNLVATFALAGIILMSVSSANAGFLISDFGGRTETPNPCKEKTDVKVDNGIIVSGFTGIIVSGFTGIIVSGYTDISCGLLMSD
jgi:hypothetical protein